MLSGLTGTDEHIPSVLSGLTGTDELFCTQAKSRLTAAGLTGTDELSVLSGLNRH